MLGILVMLSIHAIVVLGVLVRILFQENKQVRSALETRLDAIEGLEGSFARKLADVGPAALRRCLILNIYLDVRFWVEVLQLTPLEMDEIKTRIRPRDDLSENT